MIAPTLRAIWLMLLGLPVLLVVAVLAPAFWGLSGAWIGVLFGLILVDIALAARRGALSVTLDPPRCCI